MLSLSLLTAAACSPKPYTGPGTPEIGKEYVPPDEEKVIASIVDLFLERVEARTRQNAGQPARRAQHVKAQGCVRAVFTVDEDVPAEARHGVWREPGKSYPAWLRFSNGAAQANPDSAEDGHGMSIKLMGVDGEKLLESQRNARTQDFVLINHPDFFLRNARDFLDFMIALDRGKARSFFLGWNPFRWRLREGRNLTGLLKHRVLNPLTTAYYSEVPSRLGEGAVKYMTRPCEGVEEGAPPAGAGPDFLREAMARRLNERPACFDFMVQWQKDPVKMPIEDAAVPWEEKLSPYVKVARISVPSQSFDDPDRQSLCENLSFTPWHSLPEHRPLGGIQRARLEAYRAISGFRHMKNKVPNEEPNEPALQ